jgi:hypothetical protein
MLESAFLNKLYAEFLDNERKAGHLKANNRVWSYVGRFITRDLRGWNTKLINYVTTCLVLVLLASF